MTREQAYNLLPLLIAGDLDADTQAQLQARLDSDAELRDQLAQLRAAFELTRQGTAGLRRSRLNPARRARILSQVGRPMKRRRPTSWTLGSRVALAAAVLVLSVALIGLFLPSLGAARRTARQMQGNTQLRGIHQGLVVEGQRRGGVYAEEFGVLLEDNYVSPEYFLSPQENRQVPADFDQLSPEQRRRWAREEGSYVFIAPGQKEMIDSEKIVGFEKLRDNKKQVSIVYDDNHVVSVPLDEARRLIERQTGQTVETLTRQFEAGPETFERRSGLALGQSMSNEVWRTPPPLPASPPPPITPAPGSGGRELERGRLGRADDRSTLAQAPAATAGIVFDVDGIVTHGRDGQVDERLDGVEEAETGAMLWFGAGSSSHPGRIPPPPSPATPPTSEVARTDVAPGRTRPMSGVAKDGEGDVWHGDRGGTRTASGPMPSVAPRPTDSLPVFENAPEFALREALPPEDAPTRPGEDEAARRKAPSYGLFGDANDETDFFGVSSDRLAAPEESVATPLPQALRQAMAMPRESRMWVDRDPSELLHDAQRSLQAGDVSAARDVLDLARSHRSADALREVRQDDRFSHDLVVMQKRLELAERVLPLQEALQQQAEQAQVLLDAAEVPSGPPLEPVLEPGSRVAVSVFDRADTERESAFEATIDRQGRVAVPNLGHVEAVGLTPTQLQRVVEDRLRTSGITLGDVRDPTVAIIVPPEIGAKQTEPPDEQAKPEPEAQPEPAAEVRPVPRLMPVNPWTLTEQDYLSTFALDVDTASYGIARRYLGQGFLPPRHTVRMEEFVNAFDYHYPAGRDDRQMFAVYAAAGPSPFGAAGRNLVLMKIGIRGKVVGRDQLKPAHFVFVIDTSGSMDRADRLPLVQHSLRLLLDELAPVDRVSVVTYGTQANLLLEATPAREKQRILQVIDALQCGGSTNLAAGVEAGFQIAARHYTSGATHRVVLCSDGVANVGPQQAQHMLEQVAGYRAHGIGLTTVGVGAGTYNDRMLEDLANQGDGRYLYVGGQADAQRLFVEEMAATVPTIARDVKIQVEFNPQRVRRYRLIGYENRDIRDEDFRVDSVKGGEVGSGKSATALYELELIGPAIVPPRQAMPDLGRVFVRYEDVQTRRVEEVDHILPSAIVRPRQVQDDPRFFLAAAAAQFAELLRESEHAVGGNFQAVSSVLEQVCNVLPLDQRARELLEMTRKADGLPRAEQ